MAVRGDLSVYSAPGLHGHFPYHLENPQQYPLTKKYEPYFQPVQNAVAEGKMFNFYNQYDYPTGDFSELPGSVINVMRYVNASWLVDQLIKPYRSLSFPIYGVRAFKMVYGAQDLTYEEKMKFVHDLDRMDRYCISAYSNPCGTTTGCTDFPMYDFSNRDLKFNMIAYGCPSYSRSLGGLRELLDASSGFTEANEVNLQAAPHNYREFVMWHGAQFRGMLAKQKSYWRQFLSHIGSTTP